MPCAAAEADGAMATLAASSRPAGLATVPGPGAGRTTVTTRVMAAASAVAAAITAPARTTARLRRCPVARPSRAAGSMAVRAIGSACSWKAAVSSRRRSSSVSMLFPSSSCFRLVPRRAGQPGPRATGPAHGRYGTSPCPPCTRARPLSPPPTGPPRTAAQARPAAAAAAGGRHAAATAGRAPQRRHRSPTAAPSGPGRAFPHPGAAGPATDP